MEINVTALWRFFTAPITWLYGLIMTRRVGRSSNGGQKLSRVKVMRLVAVGSLACVVLGVVLFFVLFAWYSRDLPKPGQVVRREGFSTKIFDRNGQLLYDLFNSERRNPITIDQVPESLKQATIAIEDKDFYKHGGFDFLTIIRIPYNLVVRRRVIGGSTLTQQLVKNVLLTNERSLPRKFKEFVLALQIERTFTKDQILEMYLNEAPYGGTAWGIGAASEIYFNKPVKDLTLVESAILAGLPQRPTAYSPLAGKTDENGTPLWHIRTTGVLASMKRDGYISDEEYNQAVEQLGSVQFQKGAVDIHAPHFVFYVRDQLEKIFGEDVVERGGLTVTTTLNLDIQREAEKIVEEEIGKVVDYHITNGAALVMDPRTGEIITMVGSKNYFADDIDGQYNVAVDALRQPGSSIKPVTYLGMLQRGYTPASILADVETVFATNDIVEPYKPKNYDGRFRGPVTLRDSLGSSLNIPAVKSLAIVGVDNFLTLAHSMGFPTLEPTPDNLKRFGLAVTLGGAEVHMIDTVSAYSAFANGGTRVEPVSILKVQDIDGSVLYEHRPIEGPQVMKPEEAFLINDILSDNSARLMAFGANSLLNTGKPIAVKTGTTNDQKDNWAIGWSQEVIVGSWVGNNDNTSMTRVASGVTGASPIWRKIIDMTLKNGYKAPSWKMPEGIEQAQVDMVSGYPEHDGYPTKTVYVIKGTLPALPDPIHTKLKLCRGENKLATEAKIAGGDFDEKEFVVLREDDPVSQDGKNRWQDAINVWVMAQGDEKYKVPTEYCGESGDVFVKVETPKDRDQFPGEEVDIKLEANSGDGIEKLELWVDGSLRETVNDRVYQGKIKLSAGQHEIYARARSRSGKEAESNHVKIGTGGQPWEQPSPSPSPSPSPAPPSPEPSPSPSPVAPSPSPSPSDPGPGGGPPTSPGP